MRGSGTRHVVVVVLQAAILVAVIVVWELGTTLATGPNRFLVDPFIWSKPSRIVGRLGEWLQSGIILNNVFITLYEALMGFLLGALTGVVVGFVLGGAARARYSRSAVWSPEGRESILFWKM